MRLSTQLQGMLEAAGYSGLPSYFIAKNSKGLVYDRDTRFTQKFIDDAEPEQVMAVVIAIENSPWPENAELIWARDESATVVKDFR